MGSDFGTHATCIVYRYVWNRLKFESSRKNNSTVVQTDCKTGYGYEYYLFTFTIAWLNRRRHHRQWQLFEKKLKLVLKLSHQLLNHLRTLIMQKPGFTIVKRSNLVRHSLGNKTKSCDWKEAISANHFTGMFKRYNVTPIWRNISSIWQKVTHANNSKYDFFCTARTEVEMFIWVVKERWRKWIQFINPSYLVGF